MPNHATCHCKQHGTSVALSSAVCLVGWLTQICMQIQPWHHLHLLSHLQADHVRWATCCRYKFINTPNSGYVSFCSSSITLCLMMITRLATVLEMTCTVHVYMHFGTHKLHCAEVALIISWQTNRLLVSFSVFFTGKHALSRLTNFSDISAVLGWRSSFSKCGVQHQQHQHRSWQAQATAKLKHGC